MAQATAALSDDALRVIAGLVNGTEIDSDLVIAPDDTWAELRAAFPAHRYHDMPCIDGEPNDGLGTAWRNDPDYAGICY